MSLTQRVRYKDTLKGHIRSFIGKLKGALVETQ